MGLRGADDIGDDLEEANVARIALFGSDERPSESFVDQSRIALPERKQRLQRSPESSSQFNFNTMDR